jgi:hypothetical protein
MSPLAKHFIEADLLRQVRDWLDSKLYFYWRQNTQATRIRGGVRVKSSAVGAADLMGILPNGRYFCIECKIKGNKQSFEQKVWQEAVEKNHGIYILAYDLETIVKRLACHGY